MRTTLWIAVAAAALSAGAQAQRFGSNADAWAQLKKQYDENQDGKIDKAEYPRGDKAFANLDRDKDGSLTEADFPVRRQRSSGGSGNAAAFGGRDMGTRMAQMVARTADADTDGEVTGAEWKKLIAALGADEAGVIAVEKLGERIAMGGRRPGQGGRPRGPSERMLQMMTRAIDKDEDGKLEVADLEAVFAALDQDEDKKLAGEELGGRARRQPGGGRDRDRGDRPTRPAAPKAGDVAPDFDLPYAADPKGEKKTVKLSSFAGKKPVALIFGSYT